MWQKEMQAESTTQLVLREHTQFLGFQELFPIAHFQMNLLRTKGDEQFSLSYTSAVGFIQCFILPSVFSVWTRNLSESSIFLFC